MGRFFQRFRHGFPAEQLWEFDYLAACQIQKPAAFVGVEFVPYHLRHSGPSRERLVVSKTLLDI